jgi:biopolymer transport protein ExbB
LLLWYALGYRLLTLRRGSRLDTRQLLAVCRQRVRACDQALSRRPRGIIDAAAAEGAALIARRPPNPRRALEDLFFDYRDELSRYAVVVQAIVIVAPLTGLLGTVAGMIETFDALGDMSLFSRSGGIAGGVSQALVSTQMGLSVAVPGLLVGRVLARRQHRLEQELDELTDVLSAQAHTLGGTA